jgi:hypothetical protein
MDGRKWRNHMTDTSIAGVIIAAERALPDPAARYSRKAVDGWLDPEVTGVVRAGSRRSRRSSIWRTYDVHFRFIFDQGTPISPAKPGVHALAERALEPRAPALRRA